MNQYKTITGLESEPSTLQDGFCTNENGTSIIVLNYLQQRRKGKLEDLSTAGGWHARKSECGETDMDGSKPN